MAKKPEQQVEIANHSANLYAAVTPVREAFSTNAHPAADYITPTRLIDPSTPLPRQVMNQVYGGSGAAMSFSAATLDPRNPAGWPTTTDRFPSLLTRAKR